MAVMGSWHWLHNCTASACKKLCNKGYRSTSYRGHLRLQIISPPHNMPHTGGWLSCLACGCSAIGCQSFNEAFEQSTARRVALDAVVTTVTSPTESETAANDGDVNGETDGETEGEADYFAANPISSQTMIFAAGGSQEIAKNTMQTSAAAASRCPDSEQTCSPGVLQQLHSSSENSNPDSINFAVAPYGSAALFRQAAAGSMHMDPAGGRRCCPGQGGWSRSLSQLPAVRAKSNSSLATTAASSPESMSTQSNHQTCVSYDMAGHPDSPAGLGGPALVAPTGVGSVVNSLLEARESRIDDMLTWAGNNPKLICYLLKPTVPLTPPPGTALSNNDPALLGQWHDCWTASQQPLSASSDNGLMLGPAMARHCSRNSSSNNNSAVSATRSDASCCVFLSACSPPPTRVQGARTASTQQLTPHIADAPSVKGMAGLPASILDPQAVLQEGWHVLQLSSLRLHEAFSKAQLACMPQQLAAGGEGIMAADAAGQSMLGQTAREQGANTPMIAAADEATAGQQAVSALLMSAWQGEGHEAYTRLQRQLVPQPVEAARL
jgi:hypothetical protein